MLVLIISESLNTRQQNRQHENRSEDGDTDSQNTVEGGTAQGVAFARDVGTNRIPAQPTHQDGNHQTTDREADIGGEVIEPIKEVATQPLRVSQRTERQCAESTDDHQACRGDDNGFRARPLQLVLQERNVQFQHRNGTRQSGDQQASVKDDSKQVTERHLREDGGHRHERQTGTGPGFKTKGEDGGHHHQCAQDGTQNR